MSYEAQISRSSPTAFLFVVDQSGSMSDTMASGKSKAEFVSDALNRTIMDFVIRCRKADGVRDYFDVGVLGYGGKGVSNGFSGALGATVLNPISAIEQNPVRVEDRKKKMDDGAGGILETSIKFPVWFEPKASGGTPMREALTRAAEELVAWCDAHPASYPPTVLHVTDGESTDGDPEEIATHLDSNSDQRRRVVDVQHPCEFPRCRPHPLSVEHIGSSRQLRQAPISHVEPVARASHQARTGEGKRGWSRVARVYVQCGGARDRRLPRDRHTGLAAALRGENEAVVLR